MRTDLAVLKGMAASPLSFLKRKRSGQTSMDEPGKNEASEAIQAIIAEQHGTMTRLLDDMQFIKARTTALFSRLDHIEGALHRSVSPPPWRAIYLVAAAGAALGAAIGAAGGLLIVSTMLVS